MAAPFQRARAFQTWVAQPSDRTPWRRRDHTAYWWCLARSASGSEPETRPDGRGARVSRLSDLAPFDDHGLYAPPPVAASGPAPRDDVRKSQQRLRCQRLVAVGDPGGTPLLKGRGEDAGITRAQRLVQVEGQVRGGAAGR